MDVKIIANANGDDRLIWCRRIDGHVEILDIHVGSERRTGVGRNMVSELLKSLPPETTVFAITRVSNEIAQQFWEALQFTTMNVLRRFYDDEAGLMYLRKAGGPV